MEWSLSNIAKKAGMFRRIFFSVAIITLVFSFSSCHQNNNDHKGEFAYYYFPAKNVYYDSANQTFFYSLNGGKNWNRFTNLNNSAPASLGERVLLYSPSTEIYKDNDKHRKIYGGALYDISLIDTGSAVAAAEISERKIIQKRKSEPLASSDATKVKRGIGKLIDKIFGKHHKK